MPSRSGLKVVFAGTPAFAASHLDALIDSRHEVIAVVTQPDRPGKRGTLVVAGPVKQCAQAHGITVVQPQRLRATDLAPFGADVLVVVAYGQILKPDVLSLPVHGCINVHASLLPRWRGAAPIQRALLAGDTRTGVCVMQMDEGLDTGAVLFRREVAIAPDDTTATLTDKLAVAGADALLTTLDQLTEIEAQPQPGDGITYANKIEKAEAQIDWQRSAAEIDRTVRAFNPDPVAWSMLNGLRVKIWQTLPADPPAESAAAGEDAAGEDAAGEDAAGEDAPGEDAPGQILALDNAGLTIACGTGTLVVTRLQLSIGKGTVMSARDLINARRKEFTPGNRFG